MRRKVFGRSLLKRISEDVRKQVLEGSLMRAILVIAVPVVINSMIQTCYNLTDTYWLGKVGTDALAAINLVTPVQNIVINFGSGISVAGSVLISQYLGAGKKDEANRMANQVFSCAILFACVCAGLICLITPAMVRWLGAENGVLAWSGKRCAECRNQLSAIGNPGYAVSLYDECVSGSKPEQG